MRRPSALPRYSAWRRSWLYATLILLELIILDLIRTRYHDWGDLQQTVDEQRALFDCDMEQALPPPLAEQIRAAADDLPRQFRQLRYAEGTIRDLELQNHAEDVAALLFDPISVDPVLRRYRASKLRSRLKKYRKRP